MQSHPLKIYAQNSKVTLAQIAVAAKTSRMTLHRVIRGGNTTLELLRRISDATDGEVSVQSLVAASDAMTGHARHVNESAAPLPAGLAR